MREKSVNDVTFKTVREDPEKYKGSFFIWGGFIAGIRTLDETVYIEVVQNPIDKYGNITDTDISYGRFLAESEKEIDPLIYERGRLLTVAGEFTGIKEVQRRKKTYKYPVLKINELYLWREEPVVYEYYWADYWNDYRRWPFYPYWPYTPWPYYSIP